MREEQASPRKASLASLAQALGFSAMVVFATIMLTSFLSPGLARPEVPAPDKVVLPPKKSHADHGGMMKGPFSDGPSVTRACLACHPVAGQQMLRSEHRHQPPQPCS